MYRIFVILSNALKFFVIFVSVMYVRQLILGKSYLKLLDDAKMLIDLERIEKNKLFVIKQHSVKIVEHNVCDYSIAITDTKNSLGVLVMDNGYGFNLNLILGKDRECTKIEKYEFNTFSVKNFRSVHQCFSALYEFIMPIKQKTIEEYNNPPKNIRRW
jgi:hypothetical protein